MPWLEVGGWRAQGDPGLLIHLGRDPALGWETDRPGRISASAPPGAVTPAQARAPCALRQVARRVRSLQRQCPRAPCFSPGQPSSGRRGSVLGPRPAPGPRPRGSRPVLVPSGNSSGTPPRGAQPGPPSVKAPPNPSPDLLSALSLAVPVPRRHLPSRRRGPIPRPLPCLLSPRPWGRPARRPERARVYLHFTLQVALRRPRSRAPPP